MNFLKLRDGALLLNANEIASVEFVREGMWAHVGLSSGRAYDLRGADAQAVLDAITPMSIEAVVVEPIIPDTAVIASAIGIPEETLKADVEAVTYSKPSKRTGKKA